MRGPAFFAYAAPSRKPAHGSGPTWIATPHRVGLAPTTPCQSPSALRSSSSFCTSLCKGPANAANETRARPSLDCAKTAPSFGRSIIASGQMIVLLSAGGVLSGPLACSEPPYPRCADNLTTRFCLNSSEKSLQITAGAGEGYGYDRRMSTGLDVRCSGVMPVWPSK